MNIKTILFVCGIITIVQAVPRPSQSPFFEVRNGILVRTGKQPASTQISTRVVGGDDAEPGSAPWAVSLQWGIIRPAHFCGGSIIRPNWVISGNI